MMRITRNAPRGEPSRPRRSRAETKPPRSHRIVVYFVSPHVMVRTMGVWNHRPSAAEAAEATPNRAGKKKRASRTRRPRRESNRRAKGRRTYLVRDSERSRKTFRRRLGLDEDDRLTPCGGDGRVAARASSAFFAALRTRASLRGVRVHRGENGADGVVRMTRQREVFHGAADVATSASV